MTLAPIRRENRIYFPADSHETVLAWCRDRNVTLDKFAANVGLNRATLVNILKGIDAVPTRTAIAINDQLSDGPDDSKDTAK